MAMDDTNTDKDQRTRGPQIDNLSAMLSLSIDFSFVYLLFGVGVLLMPLLIAGGRWPLLTHSPNHLIDPIQCASPALAFDTTYLPRLPDVEPI